MGITLVDIHLNWLNLLSFLIFVGSLLVILLDSIVYRGVSAPTLSYLPYLGIPTLFGKISTPLNAAFLVIYTRMPQADTLSQGEFYLLCLKKRINKFNKNMKALL